MQPIKIKVNATRAVCTERPDPITTGMVGLRAEFALSADWDGLQKTAVCVGSGVTRDALGVQDAITVPHECLTDPASELKIGLYGVNSSGDLVIPTIYAYCGRLFRGADPSGDESADPTLPIWAQLQAMIGSLDNLTTTAKENLVAAINEAAKTGGSGGGGTPADVKMKVSGGYIQYSTDGGVTWTNLIAMADLIGPAGPAGADGSPGQDGADGQDGITPTIGSNGNWYLGSTDTGKPSRGETGPAGSDGKDGADGQPGRDGVDGQDGVGIQSVEQTTTSTEDGGTNVVTVTKTDGTSSTFSVKNGSKGSTGPAGAPGAAGADGYTPVKGTDYFTESDKQEIAESAAGMVSIPDKLPNPNALTFTGAVTGSYDGSAPMEVNIPSGGGEGTWKHIRKVVIPEDITTDESGVSFSERENGGYIFAFDTDENGEPFEVGDLFVIYSAGSSSDTSYDAMRSPVTFANRNTPSYGLGSPINISTPIAIGKTTTKTYGWAKCEKIGNYMLASGSYNAGAAFYTLYAARTPVSVSSKFTAINAFLMNMPSFGFESSSTFDFYGR